MKRRVALIGTGGTMSSIGRDSLDRMLAMLALTRTDDVADVQRMFDEY